MKFYIGNVLMSGLIKKFMTWFKIFKRLHSYEIIATILIEINPSFKDPRSNFNNRSPKNDTKARHFSIYYLLCDQLNVSMEWLNQTTLQSSVSMKII